MLNSGADMCLCYFNQVIHPPLWHFGLSAMLSWAHGNPKANAFTFQFGAHLDALVSASAYSTLSTPMWTFIP
jgi:hypothetical protein